MYVLIVVTSERLARRDRGVPRVRRERGVGGVVTRRRLGAFFRNLAS